MGRLRRAILLVAAGRPGNRDRPASANSGRSRPPPVASAVGQGPDPRRQGAGLQLSANSSPQVRRIVNASTPDCGHLNRVIEVVPRDLYSYSSRLGIDRCDFGTKRIHDSAPVRSDAKDRPARSRPPIRTEGLGENPPLSQPSMSRASSAWSRPRRVTGEPKNCATAYLWVVEELEQAIDNATVIMDVAVERGTETVHEANRPEPRLWQNRWAALAKIGLDGPQEDKDRADGPGLAFQEVTQALGYRQHPLA